MQTFDSLKVVRFEKMKSRFKKPVNFVCCELRSLRLFGSIRVGFVSVVDNDVINVMF